MPHFTSTKEIHATGRISNLRSDEVDNRTKIICDRSEQKQTLQSGQFGDF